jgi:ADP-heptose:LPS heptosyltransferase
MRILLIQLKRIGDLILTAPAVQELRAQLPEAELVLMVPQSCAELAAAMPVDQVLAYEPGPRALACWAVAAAGEWDRCYDFSGTDRTAGLTLLTRAPLRVGYAAFASKMSLRRHAYSELCDASVRELHTVDFHRSLLGLPTGGALPAGAMSLARPELGLPQRYAVVHPGTAREEKFWPSERWAEVIQSLVVDHQLPVVVTGTGTGLEAPHLLRLHAALKVPVVNLTGKLSLMETGGVIAGAALALGVDSMAMHFAALAAVPQVVLYGPTNPHHWRPLQAKAQVLLPELKEACTEFHPKRKGQGMEGIQVETVLAAVNRALG